MEPYGNQETRLRHCTLMRTPQAAVPQRPGITALPEVALARVDVRLQNVQQALQEPAEPARSSKRQGARGE